MAMTLQQRMDAQIDAQRRAQALAREERRPVDDGYGNRWHPPGIDGRTICSPGATSSFPYMQFAREHDLDYATVLRAVQSLQKTHSADERIPLGFQTILVLRGVIEREEMRRILIEKEYHEPPYV